MNEDACLGVERSPVPIVQTTPSYTDAAIKAKVQGVVWLQAIIRKDGTVDSFKVIRGLGYGLDEQAIQEIAWNWRFKPECAMGNSWICPPPSR